MIYWVLKKIFLGPVLKVLFRPWTKGLDNLPVDGPAVLASNHLSFSDSIFMPLMVPRPVVFLAKSDYFTGRGIKGRLTAAFFKLTNQLPMDRSGGAASAGSLQTGVEVLNGGGLLGIYPEGTRSPDGRLYRGKVGVAKLVLTANVPVIPVAMIGTDKVQPIGRRIPTIRRLGVIFGEPMDFSRYQGMADDRFVQRSVTDEIMYELMRLSGQEYVDSYASTVKDKIAAEKTAKSAVKPAAAKDADSATGKDAEGGKNASEAVRIAPPAGIVPGTVTIVGAAKDAKDQPKADTSPAQSAPPTAAGSTAEIPAKTTAQAPRTDDGGAQQ
ncbi:1-acyl-sn-glycerol-3-phosphate acyltransferase [Arthrobacter sp.]|uniref:1-acyl-sn-glycerol-3-phosphate acyltransferase n=1 Tax=Arthrobacter sp. TaxID=1667 RepID=UPI0026E090E6|nr:1-acyl-sn-glycerol-3-phosphate acyltransferase [Arthrobacter sp.]MDO5751657.1 1-acyl-sn-glycerol-3-phosphate acyltransferase [Arthrobacter sp.]